MKMILFTNFPPQAAIVALAYGFYYVLMVDFTEFCNVTKLDGNHTV